MTAPHTVAGHTAGIADVVATLRQYIDDLRYPPDSDSRPRRIAAAERAIAVLSDFHPPSSVDAGLLGEARWYVHGYLEAGEHPAARELLNDIDAAIAKATAARQSGEDA